MKVSIAFFSKLITRLTESSVEIKQISKCFVRFPIARKNTEIRFLITFWYLSVIQLFDALFYFFVHNITRNFFTYK